jgi:hypothetical protein
LRLDAIALLVAPERQLVLVVLTLPQRAPRFGGFGHRWLAANDFCATR